MPSKESLEVLKSNIDSLVGDDASRDLNPIIIQNGNEKLIINQRFVLDEKGATIFRAVHAQLNDDINQNAMTEAVSSMLLEHFTDLTKKLLQISPQNKANIKILFESSIKRQEATQDDEKLKLSIATLATDLTDQYLAAIEEAWQEFEGLKLPEESNVEDDSHAKNLNQQATLPIPEKTKNMIRALYRTLIGAAIGALVGLAFSWYIGGVGIIPGAVIGAVAGASGGGLSSEILGVVSNHFMHKEPKVEVRQLPLSSDKLVSKYAGLYPRKEKHMDDKKTTGNTDTNNNNNSNTPT